VVAVDDASATTESEEVMPTEREIIEAKLREHDRKPCVADAMVGKTFALLTVLAVVGRDSQHRALIRCKCACGRETTKMYYEVRSGGTRSCGCLVRNNLVLASAAYAKVRKRRVTKSCPHCGEQFAINQYALARGHGKFCSISCATAARRERTQSPEILGKKFWACVEKNGPVQAHAVHLGPCWQWTGTRNRGGYGVLSHGRHEKLMAHRASWLLHNGPPRELVLHRCDNPSCVNPSHLFEGSHADNIHDMVAKGRNAQALDAKTQALAALARLAGDE
jgi:hypothetical protein